MELFPHRVHLKGRGLSVMEYQELKHHAVLWFHEQAHCTKSEHLPVVTFFDLKQWYETVVHWYSQSKRQQRRHLLLQEFDDCHLVGFFSYKTEENNRFNNIHDITNDNMIGVTVDEQKGRENQYRRYKSHLR